MELKDVKIYVKRAELLPEYATPQSSGFDFKADIEAPFNLMPGERKLIPTGVYMELPDGYECQVRPRSGLALKRGITVLNTPGTVDADYRGEVGVIVINHGTDPVLIEPMIAIAQGVICPVVQANFIKAESLEELSKTERGNGGYGHSDKKKKAAK